MGEKIVGNFRGLQLNMFFMPLWIEMNNQQGLFYYLSDIGLNTSAARLIVDRAGGQGRWEYRRCSPSRKGDICGGFVIR